MGKQTKKPFFNPKKIIKFGKKAILPMALGFVILLICLPMIQKKRMEDFKKNSKPYKICGKVDNKYMIERDPMDGRADTSKPVVIFKVDNLRCKYSPNVKEWAGFKIGEEYLIQGKATSTRCKIEKIEKGCGLEFPNEFPKFN
jgi:hypothetical protein